MTKKQKAIYSWFVKRRGYLKSSIKTSQAMMVSELGAQTLSNIKVALQQARKDYPRQVSKKQGVMIPIKTPSKSFGIKRLFFDIETSYNIVSSWRIGHKISIGSENIHRERAIICVCWKWQGEDKVHSLEWNKGDDKDLLVKFIKELNKADEIVGHNSDHFDIKWLRTRCYINNVPMMPSYKSLDTLKQVKAGFNFNSNRLDYLGRISGFGGKADTGGLKLWDKIIWDNCEDSMKIMVDYCKVDVIRLEQVYTKLNPYTPAQTHVGVINGKNKCTCPNCGSDESIKWGIQVSAVGTKHQKLQCKGCNKYYRVLLASMNKFDKLNMKKE